jgi:hypothetical protein
MAKKDKSFWQKNWLTVVVVVLLMAVVVSMCFFLASNQTTTTPRETALETLILTVFSFAASFLVSKVFAERSYSQTLRDHGVQIASGIIVLKRQIENLSEWTALKRVAFKRDEPVEAAFEHVQYTLNMFRDMNDAALGGIAGVIGDALAQYETVMVQVSKIRGDALEKTNEIEKQMQIVDPGQIKQLQDQIKEINEQSEKRISELSRSSLLPIPAPALKRKFSDKCPYCSGVNYFEMLDRPGTTKVVVCSNCGGRFNAHVAFGQRVFTRPHLARHVIPNSVSPTLPAGTPGTPSAAISPAVDPGELATPAAPLATTPPPLGPPTLGITQAQVGTFTMKDSLLVSKDWIYSDHKAEAQRLLAETQSWVQPEVVRRAVSLLVSADQQMRSTGQKRTANNLQTLLFAKPEENGLPNGAIRKVVKLALHGSAFEFATFKTGGVFGAEYLNLLDEPRLLTAYARGCIKRLSHLRPISVTDHPWLAELLFGDLSKDWEQAISQMVAESVKNN